MPASPARHFNLAGASNFRDLGGYPARDGRIVRWRQIFRSNHLGHVTKADIGVLRDLGLKSAFDFRGVEERAAAICSLPEIAVHSLPIEPSVVATLRARAAHATLTKAGLDAQALTAKAEDPEVKQALMDNTQAACGAQSPVAPWRQVSATRRASRSSPST